MQVQLETCNLEYCDFVETRIKEYENAEHYYNDTNNNIDCPKYKGVVLYFVKKMLVANALPKNDSEYNGVKLNTPHYEYMPINIPIVDTEKWIAQKKNELKQEYVLYKINYWYLDTISCVLVQRNREWFNAAVPMFISIWETIEKERITGYAHRATVKKSKASIDMNETICYNTDISSDNNNNNQITRNIKTNSVGGGICLIKLDETGNSIQNHMLL
jgi:hypothetical protein